MTSSYVSIPVTRCTCRQVIGDLPDNYRILVENGTPKSEALKMLGVRNQCCTRSIQSATTYALQRARLGTKSLPKEEEQEDLTHVLRFEGQRGVSTNSTFTLSRVNVGSRRIISRMGVVDSESPKEEDSTSAIHSSSKQREKKKQFEAFRKERAKKQSDTMNMTPEEIIKARISKGPVEDIYEEEHSGGFLGSNTRGSVTPIGWARDVDGNVILVDVGEGYQVPYYQLYYCLAD